MVNPVAIGLTVGGEALGAYNKYSAGRKQDRTLAAQIKRRAASQRGIDARLLADIGQIRDTSPEAERAQAMNDFVSQLRAARATSPVARAGQLGEREAAELGELEAGLGQFAGRETDISARIAAPLRMRQNQERSLGRTQTDIRALRRKIEADDFLGQFLVARAGQPNPWLDLLASGLKGAGAAMSFGGAGGSTAGASSGGGGGAGGFGGGFSGVQ